MSTLNGQEPPRLVIELPPFPQVQPQPIPNSTQVVAVPTSAGVLVRVTVFSAAGVFVFHMDPAAARQHAAEVSAAATGIVLP